MAQEKRHFEILEGYPADVLAIAAHGRVTRKDYEDVLIPAFEEKVRSEGKVKLLCILGEDFSGYSPGAAWDDTKFGFLHLRELAAMAVVTEVVWVRLALKAFAPIISCPVNLFHDNELEKARSWVSEWQHEDGGGPSVDADAPLPRNTDLA
jgi:hypothetical protein